MITKWSLQFRLNETGNQSNIPIDEKRKNVMWPGFEEFNCITLLSYIQYVHEMLK